MKPKTAQKWSIIILALGIIIGYSGVAVDKMLLIYAGVIILILDMLFRYVYYRCPHCGRFLGRSMGEYCPYCGKNVNR